MQIAGQPARFLSEDIPRISFSTSLTMPVTKRGRTQESPSDIDDYDDGTGFVASDDDGPKSKRTKTVKPSSATKPAQAQTSESGEKFWEVSCPSRPSGNQ